MSDLSGSDSQYIMSETKTRGKNLVVIAGSVNITNKPPKKLMHYPLHGIRPMGQENGIGRSVSCGQSGHYSNLSAVKGSSFSFDEYFL